MATGDPLERFLAQTEPSDYRPGDFEPGDSSRRSIEAFVAQGMGTARELSSEGALRLHGVGVVDTTAELADVGLGVVVAHRASGGVGMSTTTPRPLTLARVEGDLIEVGRGHHSVRLTRKRITALLNRATLLGEVEVGTFRLDESDLIAVKAFADGVTA